MTADNKEFLEFLFREHIIDLKKSELFDKTPPSMSKGFDFERVEGMMLGLAIGDALGITSESKTPNQRRAKYGEIRNYLPNKYTKKRLGYPSDDTQLAFWTLEQLFNDGGFIPEHLANRFCEDRIFGLGKTVRGFIHNYKDEKKPWYLSGPKSAGNGALMRIAPMLIPHLKKSSPNLWSDTALSAMITHNDSTSTSACLSFVNILWLLLKMKSAPKPEWWIKTYVKVAKKLEIDDGKAPRSGDFLDYRGPLWKFVDQFVDDAFQKDLSVLEACESWNSGAFLYETLPCCIYILMKYADNPEEAIVRAVNDTKDNDTVAAIVGAAVGALHGEKEIPQRWIKKLTGRTTPHDDGKIFELLKKARKTWS